MKQLEAALPVAAILFVAVWGASGFGCIDLSVPASAHWELRGAHVAVACEGCHPQAEGFDSAPRTCIGCHEGDKPVGHYDGDCGECHSEDSWGEGLVNHAFFPLADAHAISCEQCHEGDDFDGLSSECRSCHEDVRPDDHFDSQDCVGCHTPTVWEHGILDHGFFPLNGGHELDCESCHEGDDYGGLSPLCVSCHEPDRPDDHFDGQDCGDCHLITDWEDASIDHDFFPLEHAHDVACSDCHGSDGWDDLDSQCTSCHEVDRPNNHFDGTDCEDCHEPTDWDDAHFDHDPWFPVPHRGVDDCEDCHLDEPDFSTFSCIDCHEHRQSECDDEHDDEDGYQYNSDACLDCHPDGRE
jgi:hypothetical protein